MGSITGSSNSSNRMDLAIKTMLSRDFFKTLYEDDVFLSDLMAVKSYDQKQKVVIYDDQIFDQKSKKWIVEKPGLLLSHRLFLTKYLKYEEDFDTGFITLSITHQSPNIASGWTSRIINGLNAYMSKKERDRAEKAIVFLQQKLQSNKNIQLTPIISSILLREMNTLVETGSQEFLFYVVDSPSLPIKKTSPNRPIICILGTLLGFIFALLYSFLDYLRRS